MSPSAHVTPVTEIQANPFDQEWVAAHLAKMAQRAKDGEDLHILETELIRTLWPWVNKYATFVTRKVPPDCDKNAIRSEIIWEFFQAVRRIEWGRYNVWPALLKARVRGALTATYRADDTLTRGQRRARNEFLQEENILSQKYRRSLNFGEKLSLAKRLAPRGGLEGVLYGPSFVVSIELAESTASLESNPEMKAIANMEASAVREWLRTDVPADVSRQVEAWLNSGSTGIPSSLRAQLARHVHALRVRLP